MRRNDGIPYEIRVEVMDEIRSLTYRLEGGLSRMYSNIASESIFRDIRALPGRVWETWDNAVKALDHLQMERKLLADTGEGTAKDLRLFDDIIKESERELLLIEREVPSGFKKLITDERLGSMSGRYVNEETHLFMEGFEQVAEPSGLIKAYNSFMQQWRAMMTSRNPATHFGNIMSALIGQNHAMVGLPWWRQDFYASAWKDFRVKGPMYREFQKAGGFSGANASREGFESGLASRSGILTGLVNDSNGSVRRLLGELALEESAVRNNVVAGVKAVGKKAAQIDRALTAAYGAEDAFFRMAGYTWLRQKKGWSQQAAMDLATEAMVDYSQRSGFVNFMRNTTLPFFTFGAGIIKPLSRAVIDHPERIATMAAPFIALDLVSKHVVGVPEVQPRGGNVVLNSQLPYVDEDGNFVFLNTGRYTPWGPFITGSPVESILPAWWPQVLMPSGPLVSGVSMLLNRDPRTGQKLLWELDDTFAKAATLAGTASQALLPPILSRASPRALDAFLAEEYKTFGVEMAGGFIGKPFRVDQTGAPEQGRVIGTVNENVRELRRRTRRRVQAAKGDKDRVREAQERGQREMARVMEWIQKQIADNPGAFK